MNSLFPLIITDDMTDCRDFYVSLLDFEVVFDQDWYIQLQDPNNEAIQLAFITSGHESVPRGIEKPAGIVVTAEVDSADAVHDRAVEMGLPILTSVRDEEWGQRHFIIEDPSGLLVDIVQQIRPSAEFLAAMRSG